MNKISIVTICYNEEGNLGEFYNQITAIFHEISDRYSYEIVIADNASSDSTCKILRELADRDKNFKVIFNSRNFGVNRSGSNALMHAQGDAIILMVSDLQDPPSMIPEFISKWEQGYKVVMAVKDHSEENGLMYFLRTCYYKTLEKLSDVKLIPHFTGYGLYDKQVIDVYKELKDPNPYFRGLISDIGFEPAIIKFTQPVRKHGKSKSSFMYLYNEAMLGLTSYSKIPLRIATFLGFFAGVISFIVGLFYLVYKLIFWQEFTLGSAPIIVGLFFFGAIQLFFLGIVGEYIGAIYTQVLHRPLVIEKERINFDQDEKKD
jgi:glycosyltransferase involved in cell wall biosynthesis